MKVLVALDALSSKAIISDITTRRWPDGTSMCVLHVVKPGSMASEFVDVESYTATENEAAASLVRNNARVLQLHGLNASAASGALGRGLYPDGRQPGRETVTVLSRQHRQGCSP